MIWCGNEATPRCLNYRNQFRTLSTSILSPLSILHIEHGECVLRVLDLILSPREILSVEHSRLN